MEIEIELKDRRWEKVSTYSDFVIVTSDNPRSEDPDRIIDDIIGLDPVNKNYVRITDRREAIYYAIDHAQKEDIIVLAEKRA